LLERALGRAVEPVAGPDNRLLERVERVEHVRRGADREGVVVVLVRKVFLFAPRVGIGPAVVVGPQEGAHAPVGAPPTAPPQWSFSHSSKSAARASYSSPTSPTIARSTRPPTGAMCTGRSHRTA